MADSPDFKDKALAERNAKRWYDLDAQFPNDHLDWMKTFAEFASWQEKGNHPDVPLSMWTYKEIADALRAAVPHAEQPQKSEHSSETKKTSTKSPAFINSFWFQGVKKDGTAAKYLDEDPRYQHVRKLLEEKWRKDHPEGATSKADLPYFSDIILDPKTPLDKEINIEREKAQIDLDAENWCKAILGQLDPKALKVYEENEINRIYADAGQDPRYKRALLKVKGELGTQFAAWEKDGIEKSDAEKYHFLVSRQLSAMHAFVLANPTQAEAYARQGYEYIQTALSLYNAGKEPDEETVKSLITQEGVRDFSEIFHPEQKTQRLNMDVTERLAVTGDTVQYVPGTTIPLATGETIELLELPNGGATIIPHSERFKQMPDARFLEEQDVDEDGTYDQDYADDQDDDDYDPEEGDNQDYENDDDGENEDDADEQDSEDEHEPEEGGDDSGGGQPPRRPRKGALEGINENVRRLKNLGKKMKVIKGLGGGGKMLLMNPEAWPPIIIAIVVVIVIIIIIILLILILGILGSNQEEGTIEIVPVSIEKTGPAEVANGQQIEYGFTIKYAGIADNIIVKDILPPDTKLVSATEPYQYNAVERTITWSLRDVQIGSTSNVAGQKPFPGDVYTGYGFPSPASPNPRTLSGQALANWKQYYLAHAVKAASLTGTDAGIIGAWAWLETSINPYAENCDKEHNSPRDVPDSWDDGDPNTECPYWGGFWQVGNLHPASIVDFLPDAFKNMYGNADKTIVHTVGQSVLDHASPRSGKLITILPAFPDTFDATQIATGAKSGDKQMRLLLTTLMKDDAINAYLVARQFKDHERLTPGLADKIDQYDKAGLFYTKQDFINRVSAVYDAGLVSGSANFADQQLQVTIEPLKNDIYVINQASAQVIGAQNIPISGAPTSIAVNPENVPPSTDNCAGHYAFEQTNPLKQNFGDPLCTMQADIKPADKDKLYTDIKQKDPGNEDIWFTIIGCTSQFNPNTYIADGSLTGKWGLFGMGAATPPSSTGPGPAGIYDRGDVVWNKQITNALAYNKELKKTGKEWEYWSTCYSN